MTKPTLTVGAFLALHLLLAYWSPWCVWGADLLTFYPAWAHLLFASLSALLLIPRSRSWALDWLSRIPDLWECTHRSRAVRLLLIVAAVTACVLLRSATHLLGDGYLSIRELHLSIERTGNEPLALWIVNSLHRLSLWSSAETTYRIYSIGAGIFYLLLALPVSRILGRDRLERTLILAFLLTPGFMQLFFGYVENYALPFTSILLYLLAGIQVLRGRLPLWVAAVLLGILVPLHFVLVTLAPSLLLLAILQVRRPSEGRPVPEALKALLSVGLAPLLALLILLALGFNPLTYVKGLRGTHFLPLLDPPDFILPYRLFAPEHLLDFLNQQLLIAPSAILVSLLCFRSCLRIRSVGPRARKKVVSEAGGAGESPGLVDAAQRSLTAFAAARSQDGILRQLLRKIGSGEPNRLFLLGATGFPLLFTFVANPEIGLFRDWDVLALPALPFTLWAALALIGRIPERPRLAHAGLLLCGATALHTLLWIGVNAKPAYAEARFERILKACPLSPHARSYGWETLGGYYRDRNRAPHALNAYKQALEADPENPRHWNAVGTLYRTAGQNRAAIGYFQKAVDLNPEVAETHSNMGNAYHGLGEFQKAIDHYRKAIDLNPNIAEAYSNMGIVYYTMGEFQKAVDHYQRAIHLNPGFAEAYSNAGNAFLGLSRPETAVEYLLKAIALKPDLTEAHFNLGNAYFRLRRYGTAIEYFQKAVAFKPDLIEAYHTLGAAYHNLNRPDKTKACFRKVLELDPNYPRAPEMRAWLYANP